MARVIVSQEDSAYIAARIAAFAEEAPEERGWLVPYVEVFAALPLDSEWPETFGIEVSGRLVRWSTEGDYEGTEEVDDGVTARIILVEGARQYPRLRHLIPARPPGARTCSVCGGTGHPEGGANVICSCGGVGWEL